MSSAPASARGTAADRATTAARRVARNISGRNLTEDEILGIRPPGGTARSTGHDGGENNCAQGNPVDQQSLDSGDENGAETLAATISSNPDRKSSAEGKEPDPLNAGLNASPELRQAAQEAKEYRETFATPDEARSAKALLAELNRMDTLFFSKRPEDHAELVRAIAALDSEAFDSLARAIAAHSARTGETGSTPRTSAQADLVARHPTPHPPRTPAMVEASGLTPAQVAFFHATNATAVQGVLDAIESQVGKLLPGSVSKTARSRVVGEVYRDLDSALRANRQLSQQLREAFLSGPLDAEHQRAVASLIVGRARQALPGITRRVLNEWTTTAMAASQDRRARQRAAEQRVDIAASRGAVSDGRRTISPRDLDYARMSDSDILNL